MRQPVELELEEVDRFHVEQLLQKANVSPLFASSRPPFAMLSDLDFSPRAISSGTKDIMAAPVSSAFGSTPIPPFNLSHFSDCISSVASATKNTLPISSTASSLASTRFRAPSLTRGCELSRLPLQQHHLDHGSYDEPAATGEHCEGLCSYNRHKNTSNDYCYYNDDEHYRSREALKSLKYDECAWQQSSYASSRTESIGCHDTFKDSLRAVDAAANNWQRTTVSDGDLRLLPLSSNNRDAQKVRREKLFPQHHDEGGGYLAHKMPIATSSTLFRMIPFPTETLSHERGNGTNLQNRLVKNQSPLPDAHRTANARKATRSPVFCSSSPMTELTWRYASNATDAFSKNAASKPNQPSRHPRGPQRAGVRPPVPSSSPQQLGCFSLLPPGTTSVPLPPRFPRFERKIGIYTPEARRERIKRYHEKRTQLVFYKRVTYDCRKRLASSCPRVKGRFVKRGALESETTASSDELL